MTSLGTVFPIIDHQGDVCVLVEVDNQGGSRAVRNKYDKYILSSKILFTDTRGASVRDHVDFHPLHGLFLFSTAESDVAKVAVRDMRGSCLWRRELADKLYHCTDGIFSPDGESVLLSLRNSDGEGSVSVFDAIDGTFLNSFVIIQGRWENCICFLCDSDRIAFGMDESESGWNADHGLIAVWRVSTGKRLMECMKQEEMVRHGDNDCNFSVTSLASCAFNKIFASGHMCGLIKIWCSFTGEALSTINYHSAMVSILSFSYRGELITGSTRQICQSSVWSVRREGYEGRSILLHKMADSDFYPYVRVIDDGNNVIRLQPSVSLGIP